MLTTCARLKSPKTRGYSYEHAGNKMGGRRCGRRCDDARLGAPSEAAPASSMAILKQAAQSSDVTDVRYYRRSYRGRAYYGNPGAAIGLGILGAAAGAAAYGAYGPGYYGGPYRRGYYYPY